MKFKTRFTMGIALSSLMLFSAVGMAACGGSGDDGEKDKVEEVLEDADYTVDYSNIATGTIAAGVAVHDPSIVQADGKYYIFGSHMAAATSDDLSIWNYIRDEETGNVANGYTSSNAVFTDIGNESSGALDYTGDQNSVIKNSDAGTAIWAPDVIYNEKMGKWVMYYCTNSTFNAGTICMATSDTVDGAYTWQKNLIYSGETSGNLKDTDILDYVTEEFALENYITMPKDEYNYNEYPHAIDPTVFYDEDGKLWMVYGSWSGGIYLLELDEETGDVIHPEADPDNNVDAYYGKYLLGGKHSSMEGPYILYDEESGYYYLYLSYGGLNQTGGYQIRVFRSDKVDGDYVDMNGLSATMNAGNHAFYGLKLSGNYMLPSLTEAYMATGHNSAFIDEDGKRYIVYHTRFGNRGEVHEPRVKQYFLNEEGWPCMLPYATSGETIAEDGYDTDEVVGRYYVVNQGMDISGLVAEPFILYLTEKGNVFGEDITGTWEMKDGSCYVHITYAVGSKDAIEYSGVFCRMNDEAGTEVMTFSAVGNNQSIWGVKYDEE